MGLVRIMSNRKRLWTAIALCFVLLVVGIVLWPHRARNPVQVNILGRTNAASGGVKVVIEVLNNSGRMQNYAYWAEVQNGPRWVVATNWESEHPGRLRWIESHHTNRFALSAPEGGSIWRLKFMRRVQPSGLERRGYTVVRRAGLGRVGLPEQPRQIYFFTEEMTE
jgi:hypothetical protein